MSLPPFSANQEKVFGGPRGEVRGSKSDTVGGTLTLLRVILNRQSVPNLSTPIHNKLLRLHLAVGLCLANSYTRIGRSPSLVLGIHHSLQHPGLLRTAVTTMKAVPVFAPQSQTSPWDTENASAWPSIPQPSRHPRIPLFPLQVVCVINAPSPSATPQSPWFPVLSPLEELLRHPHSSVTRPQHEEPTRGLPSNSFSRPLCFDHVAYVTSAPLAATSHTVPAVRTQSSLTPAHLLTIWRQLGDRTQGQEQGLVNIFLSDRIS